MALKLGMNFIKYTLLLISFMYLLTASVLSTIGGTVMERFSMKYFFEENFVMVGKLLFFMGLVLLFVSLLGVIGSVKESTLLINIFGSLIVIVLAIELLAVIAVNKVKDETLGSFNRVYKNGMEHYYEDSYVVESFDFLHKTFLCCGTESPMEWHELPENLNPGNKIPDSCCRKWQQLDFEDGNYTLECVGPYTVGCMDRMNIFLSKKSTTMGLIAIMLSQFIGVMLIFLLAKSIRNAKTVREVHKWQIREQIATQHVQAQQKENIHPKGILIPTNDDTNA